MPKPKKPLFNDEYLDELAKEISDLYAGSSEEKNDSQNKSTKDDKNDLSKG